MLIFLFRNSCCLFLPSLFLLINRIGVLAVYFYSLSMEPVFGFVALLMWVCFLMQQLFPVVFVSSSLAFSWGLSF